MSAPQAGPVPPRPLHFNTAALSNSTTSDSIWDRISSWAAENKAVVYTIAGVTLVVTGAGGYYYLSADKSEKPSAATATGKKKGKKGRKGKKDDESASKADTASKAPSLAASVTSGDVPVDLDELTEETIASLSEQV